jgi:hypothetical protein
MHVGQRAARLPFPTGGRTASMMTASLMVSSLG